MAMESDEDRHKMVMSFMEIAVGQDGDTARQFLEATSWNLEEAIQLFYVGNEATAAAPSIYPPPSESALPFNYSNLSENAKELVDKNARQDDGDDVRPPLPVKREVLYDNSIAYIGAPRVGGSTHAAHSVVPFRNFEEEMNSRVWEAEERPSSSLADKSQDNLASLYRPPFTLMFQGPFEKVKDEAKMQDKWLLINIQSTKEFSSHMLNRDTWANEAVAQTIKTNLIFWQVYDDTEEGRKVCNYYKLYSIPVILLLDPITGQKMHSRSGMVQPEILLEDLLPFMEGSPSDHHVSVSHKRPRKSLQTPISHIHRLPELNSSLAASRNEEDEELQQALAASMENNKVVTESDIKDVNDSNGEVKMKKPAYLKLPEEPKGDRSLLCRVGVRFPDGHRVQRNFLRTDPVQLLWSFCHSELKEDNTRPFRLSQAIPGASKTLDFDVNSTFEESDLANSMVLVTWE